MATELNNQNNIHDSDADKEEISRLSDNIKTLKQALKQATSSKNYYQDRCNRTLEEVERLRKVHLKAINIDRIWLGYFNYDPSEAIAWHLPEFENREDFIKYFCEDYMTHE